jgi:hypothetical protein
VARRGETRNACKLLMCKPLGKHLLARLRKVDRITLRLRLRRWILRVADG